VGEGLHGVPGMGHAVHCGQVMLWVGGESSGCCPAIPVTFHRLARSCPQTGENSANDCHADRLVAEVRSPPDGHCPICRYVAIGKWVAVASQQVRPVRLVEMAPMLRIVRPDVKPHRGVLARAPPHNAGMGS
jgi:hypothetical protein